MGVNSKLSWTFQCAPRDPATHQRQLFQLRNEIGIASAEHRVPLRSEDLCCEIRICLPA
jgi:hypothetical protein